MPASLPARRHAYSDRTRYIVTCLWLTGFSAAAIGGATGLRKPQVLGIAQKSEWPNRAAMTDAERQVALDELRAIRLDEKGHPLDEGALCNFGFGIRPLQGKQRKG